MSLEVWVKYISSMYKLLIYLEAFFGWIYLACSSRYFIYFIYDSFIIIDTNFIFPTLFWNWDFVIMMCIGRLFSQFCIYNDMFLFFDYHYYMEISVNTSNYHNFVIKY